MEDCKFYREKTKDCLVLKELVCENKCCTFFKAKKFEEKDMIENNLNHIPQI